jgi:hypothetical protein
MTYMPSPNDQSRPIWCHRAVWIRVLPVTLIPTVRLLLACGGGGAHRRPPELQL